MLTAFIRQTATLRAAYLPLAAAYTSSSSSTSNPLAVVATTGNATPITATGMTNATERVRSLPGGGVGAGNDTMPLVGDPRVSIWRDEEALLRASLGRLEAERELARMRRRCEDELQSLREGLKVREGQVARIVRRVITRTPAKSRRGRHAHVVANNINSTHDTAISCVESGGEEVVAATDECEGHGATVMTQDEAHTEEICRPAHPGRANKKEKAHRLTLGNAGAMEVEVEVEELDGKGRVKDDNNEVEAVNDAERSEGSNSFSGDDAANNADGDETGTTVPSGMELKMSLPGTRRGGLAGGTVHVGSNATVTSTAGGKRQAATASSNGELTKDAVGRRGRRRAGTTKKGTGSNNNNSSSSSSTKNKNKKRETGRSPAKNKKAVVKTLTKQRINSKGRTVSHNAPSSKKKVQPKPRVKTGHPTPKRKTSSSMRKQPKKQDHKNNKSKQSSLNKKGNDHTKKATNTRQRR
ncbi:hypothetical protein C3747_16g229 [Trypanosoma cruzi]|uniref:Uncharacterized protein n=2 Tax=Trypanosoma cruzi TaxID=5693 RepID=Q4D909_TRYCC|nr:hypothetical protein, conserved [Trypanosoma cruzi]EAN89004.1 hypothetical protein, conserved [Trypanosoma cruzi]PWV17893.1 hypothetical protein C3747_16g229 [Trypanosoma cruzi]RNC44936.1 hypothetical protein TcCL_NonESM05349 [Trypanosoma cruzi]|eukprot:XP_810855.1 hypothetical protein [Trypanosoma cruzi strain CL Brener]